MKHRAVNVTEFKATCLALLDDIRENGGSITITKRGQPLATVLPARRVAWKSPEGSWTGKLIFGPDAPEAESPGYWDVLNEDSGTQD